MTSPLLPILVLWLIAITAMDLRQRKVKNRMVLLGLATGAAALFSGAQPLQTSVWSGLGGMAAGFAALLPFYALRWMGAGDVKFAAVAGLWFGCTPALLAIWLGGSLLAGLHGMAVLAWRHWLQGSVQLTLNRQAIQRSIPYAGYMALVAIWVVVRTRA
ncbi:A24 family peptidase [Comamonas sp. Y6]|uniref:A24 family peptidase n=1 Tax=Comamonas resistens TaxID=3046670 RepID=A0ABY8SVH7_9BURK|nr:A24 family peptidase [Comamonas resistens]MDL5035897.1 A24 family peptidase [Comamonas resistens]WHS65301.1 A24 family peptidase [Comamonas resistens]